MNPSNQSFDFLLASAPVAARELLGWGLYVRETDGTLTGGIIVETEAYAADDEASHSFKGKTNRNSAMFDAAGTIYVYFTYGMHWCCNIATGQEGVGEAVLIRAIRPTKGIETMKARRRRSGEEGLADGPAKLCQALGINGTDNGEKIGSERFLLAPPSPTTRQLKIVASPRIGIRHGREKMWRFCLDNLHEIH